MKVTLDLSEDDLYTLEGLVLPPAVERQIEKVVLDLQREKLLQRVADVIDTAKLETSPSYQIAQKLDEAGLLDREVEL